MPEERFEDSENINLKHPDLQEGLNYEFVKELGEYGKKLGNLEHTTDVFKGRKEGTLKPNTFSFTTIEDDKNYHTFVDYGSDRRVHGQTISIFYVDKSKNISAIMGMDAEIEFDEQGKTTGIKDKFRIFRHLLPHGYSESVSKSKFMSFLRVISDYIKKGGDMDKIKYNPETEQVTYL